MKESRAEWAPPPGNLGAYWGAEEMNGVASSLQEATDRAKERGGQTQQSLPSRPGQWPLVHDAHVQVSRILSDRNPSAGCFLEPWLPQANPAAEWFTCTTPTPTHLRHPISPGFTLPVKPRLCSGCDKVLQQQKARILS